MITRNIIERVLLVRNKNSIATAFTIDIEDKEYLITARHNLNDVSDSIEIYQNNEWKKIEIEAHFPIVSSVDIGVLRYAERISPKSNIKARVKGLIFGQDVYFLGFPFGKYIQTKIENREYIIPFVKKGICSGVENISKDESIIYIDGHNNPGFSGGPVLYKPIGDEKFKIGGVISGYLTHKGEISGPQGKSDLSFVENSGIIIAYNIKHAMDTISNLRS